MLYNEASAGSDVPDEIVAWNIKPSNSTIRLTYAKTIKTAFLSTPLDFHQYISLDGPQGDYKYATIKSGFQVEFAGKFSFFEGKASLTPAWDDGLGLTLSKEFKSSSWKLEPKLKFQTPVDVTGKDEDKAKTWAQISGGAEGSYTWVINEVHEITSPLKLHLFCSKYQKKDYLDQNGKEKQERLNALQVEAIMEKLQRKMENSLALLNLMVN